MAKKIFLFTLLVSIIFLSSALQTQNNFILLELSYDNGNFTLINKTLEQGNFPTISHDSQKDYQLFLLTENREIIYSNKFDPSKLYSDSFENNETWGGLIILNETRFFVIVPDTLSGDRVQILKENKTIFETEVYNVGATSCRVK